jgi:hypothetical protein
MKNSKDSAQSTNTDLVFRSELVDTELTGTAAPRNRANHREVQNHGIGLEFKGKAGFAEFLEKAREPYPDDFLQTDAISVCADHVITDGPFKPRGAQPWPGISQHGSNTERAPLLGSLVG